MTRLAFHRHISAVSRDNTVHGRKSQPRTLAGLFGKIDKGAKVISIKDIASLEAAVAELTASATPAPI